MRIMRVKLLKDTTLTVKAGELVEIDAKELPRLAGRVEIVDAKEPEPVAEAEPVKATKRKRKKPAE